MSSEAAITARGHVPSWGDLRDTEETVPGPRARPWDASSPADAPGIWTGKNQTTWPSEAWAPLRCVSQESAHYPVSISPSLSEAIVSLHQILEGLPGTSHLPLLPRPGIRPPKAKGMAFRDGRDGRNLCFPAPSMAGRHEGPPPVVTGMEEERGPSRSTGGIRHTGTRGLCRVSLPAAHAP